MLVSIYSDSPQLGHTIKKVSDCTWFFKKNIYQRYVLSWWYDREGDTSLLSLWDLYLFELILLLIY